MPVPEASHRPIVTLTINPALDISTDVNRVESEHKLRCGPSRVEAGGGGINAARVMKRLGGHPVAVYAAGGATGGAFTELFGGTNIPAVVVPITGGTRESFTIDETSTGKEFRFVLQGPSLSEAEWRSFLASAEAAIEPNSFVVASGSLPPSVPDNFYALVAERAKQLGALCVVDASGAALKAALDSGVFMIKPSRRELEDLVGHALDSEQSQAEAAQALVSSGACEIVALSLGADGALLVTAAETVRMPTPSVTVRGTVGAGDSFLGAFVLRLAQGATPREALRTAVAAGAATASCPTTSLCDASMVAALEASLP